jgi:hypothetical protein
MNSDFILRGGYFELSNIGGALNDIPDTDLLKIERYRSSLVVFGGRWKVL